ncbi:MAG TPA: hypothetical protein VIG29_05525 [Vicinamibacteria bacterium]
MREDLPINGQRRRGGRPLSRKPPSSPRLDGEDPPIPEHASESWPEESAPASPKDWERTLARLHGVLEDLERRAGDSHLFRKQISMGAEKSRLEMLHTIAGHNSYHLGQVVLLRQLLGAWPPPSGGLTW